VRILRLDLKAFGPFTDLTLDLSSGAPGGLHVIYGANEAGKSSARRALGDLFYGFEQRTSDAYLHPYDALRIGALIESQAGVRYVERRKARKGSLRDERGEVLDDAVLERLLGGVDRATFTRTFGLGHEELRAGGEEMLRGEASIGETLFDAGAGGAGVRRLRELLGDEGDRLYRPRGKQQELNLVLERHAEARRRCQDAVLLPESHREQEASLEAARADLAALGARVEALRAEHYRLNGLFRCLPSIERRANALGELTPLASVPDVPESSRERRESAQAREVEARARAAKLEDEIARARRRLSEIEIPEGLVSLGAARVNALADAVGRTRKAREDLPRIQDQKKRLGAEMAQSLRRLGREEGAASPSALRVRAADSARIQKLSTLRDRLDERVDSAHARRSETLREKSELEKRLARIPARGNVEALSRVASLARSLGDVEAPLGDLDRASAELDREIERRCRELGAWQGDVRALAALVPPPPEVVERLIAEEGVAKSRDRALVEEADAVARRLADATARAIGLSADGDLPSLGDLEEARRERNRSVDALGEAWRSGDRFKEGDWQGQRELATRADGVADRLRREADRVARLAQAEAERCALAAEKERIESERQALVARRDELRAGLRGAASPLGIDPVSPEELSGFLARRRDLLELAERREELRSRRERLEAGRTKLEQVLDEALGAGDRSDSLSFRIERAAARELEEQRRESERRELEQRLDALTARLEADETALEERTRALAEWRENWVLALTPLGAGTALEPAAALGLLVELSELAERSERIESLEQRVQGIRRDEVRLADDVRGPAAALGILLDDNAPDQAAGEIVDRFRAAQSALEERARIELELREREAELASQHETLDAARRELDLLSRQAGVEDASELPAIERASLRARELERTLASIEATLVETSGGRSVVELLSEAEGETAPRLKARLDEIERETAETEERRASALATVARVQAGLAGLSEAQGADAVQEEQALAAAVRERVERYARIRVAGALLERAVERYRLANQGPVLRRAAALFSRLTGGAYERLLVGRDEHAIVAVTAEGRELLPEALSEGTRYQLYLSLRLASIERHVGSAEPMPLVLDDAIIHFDEKRKLAAFRVLSELGATLQVLFFTHLAHDVALARRVSDEPGSGPIAFHELGERPREVLELFRGEPSP